MDVLKGQEDKCATAIAETTKVSARAEVLGNDLRHAIWEVKTMKTAVAEQVKIVEESIGKRLSEAEEKLQLESSNLRGRHGDLKAQYSHLKSQLESLSFQAGDGLQSKLDALDLRAMSAVESVEKRCVVFEERQNEKTKVLETKIQSVMNSSDLG